MIADSVEYMVNAHWADALVCNSNCDKITPGMLITAISASTNTVLHVLAAAHEADLDFSLPDSDAISRRVGCICKVAPNSLQLTPER